MKITHVSTLVAGGAARAMHRLQDGLCQLGCDSNIFTLDEHTHETESLIRFRASRHLSARMRYRLRRMRIERDFAPYALTRPSGLEPFSDDRAEFTADVLGQLPECDVVNLHWVAGFVDYRSFFAGINKPVVWTLHDMNPFTGGCHYDLGCGRFRASCGACPQLGSARGDDLSRVVWQRKSEAFSGMRPGQLHVVATSQWMHREAEGSSLFAGLPISVIPLGLDCERFAPRDGLGMRSALGIPADARVVMFAADSVHNCRKGLAELRQALQQLASDKALFLLTLGGSDTAADDGGVRHLHLGHVGDDRLLSAIYSAADVFVIPSIQEAFGQTALEAMACGTPVVGFDVGGIPDMVRPDKTGLLAPPGDIKALAAAMARLLNDATLRGQMAAQCRSVILAEYDLAIEARRYVELYRHMLDQEGRH